MNIVALVVPQLLALVAGSFAVWWAMRGTPARWLGVLGYGYVFGLVLGAASLYISARLGFGVRFAPAAGIQIGLAIAFAAIVRRFTRDSAADPIAISPVPLRNIATFVVVALIAILVVRAASLGVEALTRPLYPWDAWQQWGTKARVWFETRELRPFVSSADWLRESVGTKTGVYTDANPAYPPLVPLLQVWTLGLATEWNDAVLGATWLGLYCALGLAFAWQLYRVLPSWLFAVSASYALLSLPFLDTHVALAGYGDLPLSVLYCFAFMSAIGWERFRRNGDAAMAVAFIAVLPFFKRPGIAWALTFLPFLTLALPPARRGLFVRILVIGAAILGAGLIVRHLGQIPLADAARSIWSVALNLFAWENWHLLWYVAVFVIVLYARRPLAQALPSAAATLALGAVFLATVFWGTELSASIANVTTLNRALLPLACAVCYFVALVVMPDVRKLLSVPSVSERFQQDEPASVRSAQAPASPHG